MRALFILLVVLCSCNSKPIETSVSDTTEVASASRKSVISETSTSDDEYAVRLNNLPTESRSSYEALEIFQNEFISEDLPDNDTSLQTFLAFQSGLLESLNTNLDKDSHFDDINSLIYADSSQWTKEGLAFEKSMKDAGLMLRFTEGTPYIEADPQFTRKYFFNSLTPPTKDYFSQFEKETLEVWSEDGGLVISIQALASRVGYWDKFIANHPDSIFIKNAKGRRDTYLYYLFAGMDNTWAFDEEQKIVSEFVDAYRFYVTEFPSTESAKVVEDYLNLLEASNWKKTTEVTEFQQSISDRE